MQRALTACLLTLVLGGVAGCSAAAPPQAPKPVDDKTDFGLTPGGNPDWLPPYTPAQIALLNKPVDHPIQARAMRVLPDLGRFWYANNRPLAGAEDALKFTKMVATILNDSPRFYTLDEGPPEIANPITQYGPPPPDEPDGLQISKRGDGGVGDLVPAQVSAEAKALFDKGAALAKKGDAEGAIAAYRGAIAKGSAAPGMHAALGDALLKAGKVPEAEAAYREAIGADPTFAPGHLGLATIADKRGDLAATRKSLAEALAYHPSSPRALALASRIGGTGGRIAPFAIFLDVDSRGAIRTATAGTGPAQMYAGCRAVMRYEPDLRAQIFDQPAETPYYLSVVEEVICIEAALGAYMVDRSEHEDAAPDQKLDDLFTMARQEGLSGYVMFEILGARRPERARVAPPEVHREVVRYVEQHVLGQKDVPEGVYNAGRAIDARDERLARAPGKH